MSARLEITGLRKSFDGLAVLDGVNLAVGAGEFVSILGPSGSGKSTLLQILTRRTMADAASIRFDGAPLDPAARPFAFMPQRDALMDWRTIADNVAIGLEVAGMKRKTARARVTDLLPEFGLAGFGGHYPSQLSGGMRQRVALLRTVVQERPMLLLDEPFGALDALTRVRMQTWLQTMWAGHGWTVLLITHDVREAVALSDRIAILSDRPARVVEDIAVPLPRPRRAGDEAAAAIEARIFDLLLNRETPL